MQTNSYYYFYDSKEAFDTNNHDIPIQKLEHCGLHDFLLGLFKPNLSKRRHLKKINK